VREDRRHAGGELAVDEPDAGHAHDTEAGT
jgi:hypothetical protein